MGALLSLLEANGWGWMPPMDQVPTHLLLDFMGERATNEQYVYLSKEAKPLQTPGARGKKEVIFRHKSLVNYGSTIQSHAGTPPAGREQTISCSYFVRKTKYLGPCQYYCLADPAQWYGTMKCLHGSSRKHFPLRRMPDQAHRCKETVVKEHASSFKIETHSRQLHCSGFPHPAEVTITQPVVLFTASGQFSNLEAKPLKISIFMQS